MKKNGSKVTAASLLEGYSAPRRSNQIEVWEASNPDDAVEFWELMRGGYLAKSIPFAHCLTLFRDHFASFPLGSNQTFKKIVDERLSE